MPTHRSIAALLALATEVEVGADQRRATQRFQDAALLRRLAKATMIGPLRPLSNRLVHRAPRCGSCNIAGVTLPIKLAQRGAAAVAVRPIKTEADDDAGITVPVHLTPGVRPAEY